MTHITVLITINCLLSASCLVATIWHHWMSIGGPESAGGRLLRAMTDLRARLELLETLAPVLSNLERTK